MRLISQIFLLIKQWRIFSLVLLFAFIYGTAWSQSDQSGVINIQNSGNQPSDNTLISDDTTKENKPLFSPDTLEHSPRKAMIYSMVLPGLGQGYNKKYFKIPFVYGILGGVGYWIHFNTQGYREAVDNYEADASTINERYLQAWRRRLEISYMTMAGAYALQVLDAYVDAYLFYWEVNPELSVRVTPTSINAPVMNYGLSCRLTF